MVHKFFAAKEMPTRPKKAHNYVTQTALIVEWYVRARCGGRTRSQEKVTKFRKDNRRFYWSMFETWWNLAHCVTLMFITESIMQNLASIGSQIPVLRRSSIAVSHSVKLLPSTSCTMLYCAYTWLPKRRHFRPNTIRSSLIITSDSVL